MYNMHGLQSARKGRGGEKKEDKSETDREGGKQEIIKLQYQLNIL